MRRHALEVLGVDAAGPEMQIGDATHLVWDARNLYGAGDVTLDICAWWKETLVKNIRQHQQ